MYRRVEVAAVVKSGNGHSQQRPSRPRRRLMIWRIGTGRTAGSRFVVRKSQNSLGQKKAKREAAVWSVKGESQWVVSGWVVEGKEGRHTGCGGEDYEAGPVVLDEFAHYLEVLGNVGSTVIGGRAEARALSVVVGPQEWAAIVLRLIGSSVAHDGEWYAV